MMRLPRPILCLAALLPLAAPFALQGATEAEAVAGRAILKKNADAMVSIELVAVVKGGGRGGSGASTDQKRDVLATVISSTGLTVTSLANIDPRVAQGRGNASDTEFKEVKIRLADNSEIPATVVLKDAELDLAFIAPLDGGREFAFVNLAETAEPTVLGTYFDMTRMPKDMQRIPVIQTVTVIGVVEKPRRLILMSDYSLGCPVFDINGKALGIVLAYITPSGAQFPVIPSAEIAEMAKQAQAARARLAPLPMP